MKPKTNKKETTMPVGSGDWLGGFSESELNGIECLLGENPSIEKIMKTDEWTWRNRGKWLGSRFIAKLIVRGLMGKRNAHLSPSKLKQFKSILKLERIKFKVLVNPPNDPKLSHGAKNRKRGFANKCKMKEQPPLAPARC